MRKGWFVFVILLSVAASSFAAGRVVLLERFTDESCTACPPCGEKVHEMEGLYDESLAIVEIHTHDDYFDYDSAAHYSRKMHYSATAIPCLGIDGMKVMSWPSAPNYVNDRLLEDAPLSITIIPGDSIGVVVDVDSAVTGEDDRLFVAITQTNIYDPGMFNFEVDIYNVLRRLLPDGYGQPIDLSTTGTQEFYFNYTWDDAVWDTVDMKIVAWVQDMAETISVYNVYNANWIWWSVGYRFEYDPGITRATLTDDEFSVLGWDDLTNKGLLEDTYLIKLVNKTMTPGWDVGFCAGEYCYPDSGYVTLMPDSSANVTVDFTAPTDGAGYVDLVITSLGSGISKTQMYYTFKNPNVLLMDQDKRDDYERYYFASLINLGEAPMVTENRGLSSGMMNYDIVICMTGAIRSPLVGSGDTTAFSMYLDGGGNLFISSQDWADYFSRLGVSYPKYYLWFKRTFRLELADDDAGIDTVIGSMGGPFEGLSLTLGGGDGADNVTDPDLIIPLTGADICMWFPDNDTACAGVCFDSCFVYFSFPWEAIDNQADRDTLMARVLNYLRNFGGITDIAKPESPLILSAVPNPFNASTELGFELSSPGDVSLDIFDISGRKVANLANGTFEDGVHELAWDGRDNTNRELPSGIYMARLVAGEKIVTKKLLLAK